MKKSIFGALLFFFALSVHAQNMDYSYLLQNRDIKINRQYPFFKAQIIENRSKYTTNSMGDIKSKSGDYILSVGTTGYMDGDNKGAYLVEGSSPAALFGSSNPKAFQNFNVSELNSESGALRGHSDCSAFNQSTKNAVGMKNQTRTYKCITITPALCNAIRASNDVNDDHGVATIKPKSAAEIKDALSTCNQIVNNLKTVNELKPDVVNGVVAFEKGAFKAIQAQANDFSPQSYWDKEKTDVNADAISADKTKEALAYFQYISSAFEQCEKLDPYFSPQPNVKKAQPPDKHAELAR